MHAVVVNRLAGCAQRPAHTARANMRRHLEEADLRRACRKLAELRVEPLHFGCRWRTFVRASEEGIRQRLLATEWIIARDLRRLADEDDTLAAARESVHGGKKAGHEGLPRVIGIPRRRDDDRIELLDRRARKSERDAAVLRESRVDERSRIAVDRRTGAVRRSEEHTSELQSHVNLVCRLLLEKKKNK